MDLRPLALIGVTLLAGCSGPVSKGTIVDRVVVIEIENFVEYVGVESTCALPRPPDFLMVDYDGSDGVGILLRREEVVSIERIRALVLITNHACGPSTYVLKVERGATGFDFIGRFEILSDGSLILPNGGVVRPRETFELEFGQNDDWGTLPTGSPIGRLIIKNLGFVTHSKIHFVEALEACEQVVCPKPAVEEPNLESFTMVEVMGSLRETRYPLSSFALDFACADPDASFYVDEANRQIWESSDDYRTTLLASTTIALTRITDEYGCLFVNQLYSSQNREFVFVLSHNLYSRAIGWTTDGDGRLILPSGEILNPGESTTLKLESTFHCSGPDCGETERLEYRGELTIRNLGLWPRSSIASDPMILL